MKLAYVTQIYKSKFLMKNGLNSINILYTSSQKSFPIYTEYGMKCLKRTVIFLNCTKHDEINIFHSDVQKHVSYTGSQNISDIIMSYASKRLNMYFKLFRSLFLSY